MALLIKEWGRLANRAWLEKMKTSSTILFSFCVVNLTVFAENGSFPLLTATNWLSPNISKSSCSFHLARYFFLVIFARKKVNVKQWENINKEGVEFFSYEKYFFHRKSWRIYEAVLCLWIYQWVKIDQHPLKQRLRPKFVVTKWEKKNGKCCAGSYHKFLIRF